jgi:asparagine synthase (glutamine-hydrolysing)
MIGGYAAREYSSETEAAFKQHSPTKLLEFSVESNEYVAWIFHNSENSAASLLATDNEIIVCDGLPVTGNPESGYQILKSNDEFGACLEQIVSNVNLISAQKEKTLKIRLASNNISCGRIYYTRPNDGSIVFSTDFRPLTKLINFELDKRAYIGIIKYGAPPDPLTIAKGIKTVPVSHTATLEAPNFHLQLQPYFKFKYTLDTCDLTRTKQSLMQSCSFLSRLEPVLLLGGGVDSTLLAHYFSLAEDKNTTAYFLTFGEDDPELKYATQAAESAQLPLNVYFMDEQSVVPTIKTLAGHYIHPFSDYSTIPTYYIIKQILDHTTGSKLVIDGTGADGCFTGLNTDRATDILKLLFRQPRKLRQIESRLFQDRTLFDPNKGQKHTLFHNLLAMQAEASINQSLITICFYDGLLTQQSRKDIEELAPYYDDLYDSLIKKTNCKNEFDAKSTTVDLVQPVRCMALKTYSAGYPKLTVAYPFLWKDILTEQQKLNCKNHNGISKYPLKKLLQERMPKDFVYREKKGFSPPITKWLQNPEILSFAQDQILSKKEQLEDIVSTDKLKQLFDTLRHGKPPSNSMGNFLWSILFTEIWLKDTVFIDQRVS